MKRNIIILDTNLIYAKRLSEEINHLCSDRYIAFVAKNEENLTKILKTLNASILLIDKDYYLSKEEKLSVFTESQLTLLSNTVTDSDTNIHSHPCIFKYQSVNNIIQCINQIPITNNVISKSNSTLTGVTWLDDRISAFNELSKHIKLSGNIDRSLVLEITTFSMFETTSKTEDFFFKCTTGKEENINLKKYIIAYDSINILPALKYYPDYKHLTSKNWENLLNIISANFEYIYVFFEFPVLDNSLIIRNFDEIHVYHKSQNKLLLNNSENLYKLYNLGNVKYISNSKIE